MQVKFLKRGTILITSIIGELDHHSAEYVRQKVDSEMIKSTTRDIIFDLSKLSFMDSSGIGVIMGRYKNIVKLSGKAVLVITDRQVKRILEMSGILKIIPAYDDTDAAVNSLQ